MNDEDERNKQECIEHEINLLLDQIKEEFFDNRIRAYKLTKMGLIGLLQYVKEDEELYFLQAIKRASTVFEQV
jgi:hypothetical protein